MNGKALIPSVLESSQPGLLEPRPALALFHPLLVSTLKNQTDLQQCSEINRISYNLSLTCEKVFIKY